MSTGGPYHRTLEFPVKKEILLRNRPLSCCWGNLFGDCPVVRGNLFGDCPVVRGNLFGDCPVVRGNLFGDCPVVGVICLEIVLLLG